MFELTMKRTYFIISCLVLTIACADTQSDVMTGELVPSHFEQQSLPGSEVSYVYSDSDGKLLIEGNELNGMRHGTWLTYSDKGAISELITYHKGVKEGVAISFDDKGNITKKSIYHDDKLYGNFTSYKNNKVIESKYYTDGELNGLARKYYDSGVLLEESNYVNGQLDGISKWYDQEGNLSIAYEYENGQLVNKNAAVD